MMSLALNQFAVLDEARKALALNEPWTSVFESTGCLMADDPDVRSYYAEIHAQRRARACARKSSSY